MSTPRTAAETLRIGVTRRTDCVSSVFAEMLEADLSECMNAIEDALNYWYPMRGDSEIEHAARKRLKAFYDAKKEGGK